MLKMGLLWNNDPKYTRLRQNEQNTNNDVKYSTLSQDECDNAENGVKYEPIQVFEAFEISDNKTLPEDPSGEYGRLRRVTICVSWVSLTFSFVSGVVAIVLGQLFGSESLFGYGLDAVLDSLSSVAVLWRFYGNDLSGAAEAKERKACIFISFFFFASFASLIFKSVKSLSDGERDDATEAERIVSDCFSGTCSIVTLVLGLIKVRYGRILQSRSLLTDSVITFAGSFMCFIAVVGLELYEYDDRIWYLDAISGLICSAFLLVFGLNFGPMTSFFTKLGDNFKGRPVTTIHTVINRDLARLNNNTLKLHSKEDLAVI